MSKLTHLLLIVSVASLGGCTKIDFSVESPPRFTTDAGGNQCRVADPTARSSQDPNIMRQLVNSTHRVCRPLGQPCINGFDTVYRYQKIGDAKSDEYVFQYLDLQVRENRNCTGHWANMSSGPRLEYWPHPALDIQASFRCSESQFEAEVVEAYVGIIELDDLSSEAQDALDRLPNKPTSKAAVQLGGMVPRNVYDEIKNKVEDDHKVKWSSKYQFDFCSRDAAGRPDPQTDCGPGKFHCLKLRYKDSNSGAALTFSDPP